MLINNKLCIVVVLVILQFFAGPKAIAQLHWESMVAEYDTWKYLAATAECYQNIPMHRPTGC